ncbi:MAG: hypothetical protein ACK4YP_15750 [Myxococcota bacterium]
MPRFFLAVSPLPLLVACVAGGLGDSTKGTPCDTGTELPAACACDAPAITIGTGDITFEPLDEGSPLTMVHGPQGGWHMLGSAKMENLLPIVRIHFTIDRVADGARVADMNYNVQMVAEGECGGYFPGMYGYLDVSGIASEEADTPPELLGGAELLLSMEVTDTEGRIASDTLRVVAALDPVDAESAAE